MILRSVVFSFAYKASLGYSYSTQEVPTKLVPISLPTLLAQMKVNFWIVLLSTIGESRHAQ